MFPVGTVQLGPLVEALEPCFVGCWGAFLKGLKGGCGEIKGAHRK